MPPKTNSKKGAENGRARSKKSSGKHGRSRKREAQKEVPGVRTTGSNSRVGVAAVTAPPAYKKRRILVDSDEDDAPPGSHGQPSRVALATASVSSCQC
jgi:hypothetical protein